MRIYHKRFISSVILMLGCNLSYIEASITTSKTNAEGSEPEKQEAMQIKGRVTFGKESIPSLKRRTEAASKTRIVTLDLPPGVNEVEIDLPDGTKRTFKKLEIDTTSTRENSSISKEINYWIGEDESDGSIFDFVRSLGGNVHGSLIDLSDSTVSQLRVDADGLPFVVVTPSSDFPDELSALPPITTRAKDGKDDESPSHRDLMMTRPNSSQVTDNYDSLSVDPISPNNLLSQNRYLQSDGFDDSGKNLDILVVWTKNAECKQSNLQKGCRLTSQTEAHMEALVDLAIAETNHAYKVSNIETELVLVHSFRHPTYVECEWTENRGDVFRIAVYDLKRFDDDHYLREEYGADMVAMIIDGNEEACGIGFAGGRPFKEWMFSVSDISCATGYYTFAHEVGHNLGLFHDRGTDNFCSSSSTTYNNGYRDPDARFRTIMAYDCVSGQCDNNPGGGCIRIPKFSSPNIFHEGKPVGIAGRADSVRFINEVKAEVASYYPHKQLTKCKLNESLLEVIVKTDANPHQTSWILKQNNTEVDSMSSYSQPNSIVTHKKCVDAGACYMFTLKDKGGDGIKNGGFVKIVEAGKTVLEVTRFNTPNSSSDSWVVPVEGTMQHHIGFPNDPNQSCKWLSQQGSSKYSQECSKADIKNACVDVCNTCDALKPLKCNWDESLLEITVKTDDHPEETSWILKQRYNVVDSKNSYTQSNAVVKYQTCVDAGSCYNFIIQDKGRDGIRNGFFKITESGETVMDFTSFTSSSAQYSIPVEGTVRHKIGWPGQSKVQCKWLKTQIEWKRNTECAKSYIKGVCPNICGTCN